MSSLVRRIQKNIAKAQGFKRFKKDPKDERFGLIVNTNDEVVGKHWPQVSAPTRPIK